MKYKKYITLYNITSVKNHFSISDVLYFSFDRFYQYFKKYIYIFNRGLNQRHEMVAKSRIEHYDISHQIMSNKLYNPGKKQK